MKAIYVDKTGMPIALSPDSAVIPNRRPWFIPDFGGEWTGNYLFALRIGRLGKGIKPEFAYRYIDAVTVAVHPLPSDTTVSSAITDFMDGALILGEWISPDHRPFNTGDKGLSLLTAGDDAMAKAVSLCSRHITLKTGDVILLPSECEPQPLEPNIKLVAFDVTATQILDINVK